jgi:hypothetical protein
MAEDVPTAAPKQARRRREAVQDVELLEPGAEAVSARPIVAEDGASLEADRVEVRLSAVGRVESSELSVAQGAVGAARTDHLTVEQGAVGAVMADRAEVSRGYVRSILARHVQLDRSAARVVIAADVNAQQTAVMFLIARRVGGEVRVLFDWRGALAFGAGAGLIFGLVSRLRRRPR